MSYRKVATKLKDIAFVAGRVANYNRLDKDVE